MIIFSSRERCVAWINSVLISFWWYKYNFLHQQWLNTIFFEVLNNDKYIEDVKYDVSSTRLGSALHGIFVY